MQNDLGSGREGGKMKKKITHNLLLKVMSVVLAFILWLVVVNINDPDSVRTIRAIEITILNEQAITGQGLGQVYTIRENRTAAVVVKGPRSIVDKMDKSDIKATVDFSEVSSVGAVPINIVSLPEGVTLQNKITENMKITAEPILSQRFEVEIETTGTPAEGFVVGNTEVSPNVVNIKAPESVMEQIRRVLIRVDVDGMSMDVSGKSVSLVLIDGNGKEIDYSDNEHITMSAVMLIAGADILKCQTIPIQMAASGSVADGYQYTGLEMSLNSVTLKGVRDIMSGSMLIQVPSTEEALDLTGLEGDKEGIIDILPYLPPGTSLLHEEERYITVTLKVEKLQRKSIHISVDSLNVLNVPDNMDIVYEVTPDSMLDLEGLEKDLAEVNIGMLNPTIDLGRRGAGTYQCQVEVTLPEGITIIRQASITVILTEIEQTEAETEPLSVAEEEENTDTIEVMETVTSPVETEEPTIPVMVKPLPEETEKETVPTEAETRPEEPTTAPETETEPQETSITEPEISAQETTPVRNP